MKSDNDAEVERSKPSRRGLLKGAIFLAGAYGLLKYAAPAAMGLFPERLQFEELASPAGFRRLKAGESTVRFDPFVGIDSQDGTMSNEQISINSAELCEVLFDMASLADTVVPIASFSDYNCPYCKVLTPMLGDLEAQSKGGVSVTWHEYPLLGESSLIAAKGALAAKRQGAYLEFHRRLMRGRLLVTPEYLERLAGDIGLSTEQFVLDMTGTDVLREIQTSMAVARLFGFIGTPALVVGRTAVQGAIRKNTLNQLIEMELGESEINTCV